MNGLVQTVELKFLTGFCIDSFFFTSRCVNFPELQFQHLSTRWRNVAVLNRHWVMAADHPAPPQSTKKHEKENKKPQRTRLKLKRRFKTLFYLFIGVLTRILYFWCYRK